MKKIEQPQVKKWLGKISKQKIFVIGDAMLDCYWQGSVQRISPEAPVPVLQVLNKYERLGGAANVALNCRKLGAEVHLFTVLGKDLSGKTMLSLLEQEGIHTDGCLVEKERITTTKTRVMAKHQQMMRIDEEVSEEISTRIEHHFIDVVMRAIQIDAPDIIIFEDYNKGLLLPNAIQKIITHAKELQCFVAVDPKKANFFSYTGVDLFKPNLKEVREALPELSITPDKSSLKKAHTALQNKINHQITLITLSEHGIFSEHQQEVVMLPAHVRQIADVSGAGDTVIAVFAACFKASNNLAWATQAANLAGGLVCETVGVHPINKVHLVNELMKL